jgi:hypothetical protein
MSRNYLEGNRESQARPRSVFSFTMRTRPAVPAGRAASVKSCTAFPVDRTSAKRQFSHKLYRPVTSYDSQRYMFD